MSTSVTENETTGGPAAALIAAGWLIDGSGRPARERVLLEMVGGRIVSVAPLDAGRLHAGGFEDRLHCTVLPALADGHVHLAMSGATDPALRERQRSAGYAELAPAIAGRLERLLSAGVAGVRDAGDRGAFARRFLGERGGGGPAVRVKTAGRAWHRPGRYGGLIGRTVPPSLSLAEAVSTDPGPCDLVKVVNSGLNSLTEFGRRTPAQFELPELSAAVAAAAAKGLEVMVHANGEGPVAAAVLAGCRSVEHGFFMGAENLERMAEKGVVWVPTAVTMQAYAAHLAASGQDPDVARRTLDHQLEQIGRARRLGVTVALGTDSGSPGVDHGASAAMEMGLLIRAGYTVEEAVRCAAFNAWRLIGGEGGLLAPGRPATFVAVEGAPDELPGSLGRVRAVFVDGLRRVAAD